MPRKTPISQREKEIGARFRQAREAAGLKQSQLAAKLQIVASRLTGYEHGRNPVPYWIGDMLARQLDVCQRWIATGAEPMRAYLPVDEVVGMCVPKSALFSDVYEALLDAAMTDEIRAIARAQRKPVRQIEARLLPKEAPLWSPPSELHRSTLRTECALLQFLGLALPPTRLVPMLRELECVVQKYNGIANRLAPADQGPNVLERERRLLAEEVTRQWQKFCEKREPLKKGA